MTRSHVRGKMLGLAIVTATFGLNSAADAACYPASQALPQAQTESFQKDPSSILPQHPDGGRGLVSLIRDLAASNNATLDSIVTLFKSANPAQRAAIGTGLGQAATLCVGPEQEYAQRIQAAVAATGDILMMTAFVSSSGQGTGTAATTAANAAAATAFVGLGSQVTGTSNPGPTPSFGPTSGPTRSQNYLTFQSGPGATSSSGSFSGRAVSP